MTIAKVYAYEGVEVGRWSARCTGYHLDDGDQIVIEQLEVAPLTNNPLHERYPDLVPQHWKLRDDDFMSPEEWGLGYDMVREIEDEFREMIRDSMGVR